MSKKKQKIVWNTEKRKVKDLKDHPHNPRVLSKKSHEDLKKSFEKYNYAELVAINADGTIVAGHQRVDMMLELGWGDNEIEVRVPNRVMDQEEVDGYLITSNKVHGQWDFDILANNFETDLLCDSGFTFEELTQTNWNDEMGNNANEDSEDEEGEVSGKEFDESITDGENIIVKFVVSVPYEDAQEVYDKIMEAIQDNKNVKVEKRL